MRGVDVRAFSVGPLQANCYVVRSQAQAPETAVVVDPGEEAKRLEAALERLGVREVAAILITHCHFDHVGAVAPLARNTGAPVYCPAAEVEVLRHLPRFAPPGFGPFEGYDPTETVEGGEQLRLAGLQFEVLATPGHSPGHLTYAIGGTGGDPPLLFSGDVLFQGSVGRTDLPGASWEVLERSLRLLVRNFGPEAVVYPGHMGVTTLGRERQTNPFLQGISAPSGAADR